MKRLLIALLLLATAIPAGALDCTTHTFIDSSGNMVVCTTCCWQGNCTTTCQ